MRGGTGCRYWLLWLLSAAVLDIPGLHADISSSSSSSSSSLMLGLLHTGGSTDAPLPAAAAAAARGRFYIFHECGGLRWFRQISLALSGALSALDVPMNFTCNVKHLVNEAREQDFILVMGPVRGVGWGSSDKKIAAVGEELARVVRQRNISCVAYETECHCDASASRHPTYAYTIDRAGTAPFKEIWTYSYEVIRHIKSHHQMGNVSLPPTVFLPPGHSASLDYREHPQNNAANIKTAVTTLMADADRRMQDAGVWPLYKGKMLANVRTAWNDDSYARLVASHYVGVCIHKRIGEKRRQLWDSDLVRMGPFLASGMRVVSERCNADDEKALAGLVTFADRSGNNSMVARVTDFLSEARNKTARLLASNHIATEFAERFNMTAMLGAELRRIGFDTSA